MWTFHRGNRSQESARARVEAAESRLHNLEYRELDLITRLGVLQDRRELYPQEITGRQVEELDRRLDEIRAEIASLRADLPTSRDER
jgi:chromosome segregation ATPase